MTLVASGILLAVTWSCVAFVYSRFGPVRGKQASRFELDGNIVLVRDPLSGDWCGIYFFESNDALARSRESELAKSIPDAYEATDARREVFEVMFPLRPEVGPIND